jgi:transketolase
MCLHSSCIIDVDDVVRVITDECMHECMYVFIHMLCYMSVQGCKGAATRNYSGSVLNALANSCPELVGGSADLSGSNCTFLDVRGCDD